MDFFFFGQVRGFFLKMNNQIMKHVILFYYDADYIKDS